MKKLNFIKKLFFKLNLQTGIKNGVFRYNLTRIFFLIIFKYKKVDLTYFTLSNNGVVNMKKIYTVHISFTPVPKLVLKTKKNV